MGDLNEWMAKAKAYDSLNERIGDLTAQLHERDMLISRLEEDLEVLRERVREAEAQNAELCQAIIDAYPTIAGYVISLEQAGETVAHEQWAKLARQLYEATRSSKK